MSDFIFNVPQNWEQQEQNMALSMIIQLLKKSNVTYDSIRISNKSVIIANPSASLTNIITSSTVNAEYSNWLMDANAAAVIAQAESQAKVEELQTNILSTITLAQINNAIDSISNLSELKVFLKKLVRYIKSRE